MAIILLLPFTVVLVKLIKRIDAVKRLTWKTAFAVAFVGALILVTFKVTSQPAFCKTCHAMRPSIASWGRSSHRGVGCLSCHREKGLGGAFIRKLEDVRMLAVNFRLSETRGLNKPVRDELCLDCHPDVRTEATVEGKVRVSHREFVGRVVCEECHANDAHENGVSSRAAVMEICSNCHDGKRVSADCSICHLDKIDRKKKPPKNSGIYHGSRWREVHGVKSQGICTACHDPEDCAKCHVQMPHPDGWTLEHGSEAKRDERSCLKCHLSRRSCDNCHQLPLPHPSGWLKSHSSNAKQRGEKLCLNCHFERDCASCHFKHNNLPQLRGEKARAKK